MKLTCQQAVSYTHLDVYKRQTSNLGISDIGFYVDTLGRTKPIDIDGAVAPINSQLIIGTEYSALTLSLIHISS